MTKGQVLAAGRQNRCRRCNLKYGTDFRAGSGLTLANHSQAEQNDNSEPVNAGKRHESNHLVVRPSRVNYL
jgi:hypothetical protein